MNNNTATRLKLARKELHLGGQNRSIRFASHKVQLKDRSEGRIFTIEGVSAVPEKTRCRKHPAVERDYGTPCGQCAKN